MKEGYSRDIPDCNAPSQLLEYESRDVSATTAPTPLDWVTNTFEALIRLEVAVRRPESLFEMGPAGRSGLKDVSERHDNYLYRSA